MHFLPLSALFLYEYFKFWLHQCVKIPSFKRVTSALTGFFILQQARKKKGEKLYKKKEEGPLFSDVQTKKLEPASGNQGKNKRRSRDSTLKLKA
jgi:hypothetical protein